MEDFLGYSTDNCNDNNDDIVTPESLAWKILMDDDIEKYSGVILPYTEQSNTSEGIEKSDNLDVRYESLSGQFEILITMYMEMVFNMLKINHVATYCDNNGGLLGDTDLEKSFNPDLSN